jgi:type VI secretion system protein VasD
MTRNFGWRHIRVAFLAVALALVACKSAPPPPKPTLANVTIEVQPDVNPDIHGRPSPVVLRLYELKALASFRDADALSLLDKDQQILGGDMVAREEFHLEPGEKARHFQRKVQADTRYLSVFAAYRDIEHSQWRASMSVIPAQTFPAIIRVEANKVSIRYQ